MPVDLPQHIAANIANFSGRSWVLPRVVDWLDTRDERVFLITGRPGAGKSMLAAWLAGAGPAPSDPARAAQLAQLRAAIKSAHFCIAGASVAAQDVIGGLARRLTETIPGFGQALLASNGQGVQISITQQAGSVSGTMTGLAVERLVLGDITPERAVSLLLVDPLRQLEAAGFPIPIVLLVDSLDEAETASAGPKVAQLLAGLRVRPDLPPWVRILATTRPDPRVLAHFKSLSPEYRLDLIDDAPAGSADIAEYALERLTELDESRRRALAQKVAAAARGIFLYAHLVIEQLRAHPPAQAEVATLELPRDLSDLYLQFLLREIGAEERWYTTYYPILGLIAVAQGEGLGREQIQRILGKPRHEVEPALRACAQYLAGSLPDGPFRPFHQSFAEFLLDDEHNTDRRIDVAEMHRQIADHYLSFRPQAWKGVDPYGLACLVPHLAGGGRSAALYELVLDPTFRAARVAGARTAVAPLPDLRAALEIALARDDLLPAMRIAATYRELTRGTSVTEAIFTALDDPAGPNFDRVFELADQYGPAPRLRGRWARVLHLYLAWEAASHGRPAEAQRAADSAAQRELARHADQLQLYESLGEALLVRTARALAQTGGDLKVWLERLAPDLPSSPLRQQLLVPPSLDTAQRAQAEQALGQVIADLNDGTTSGEPDSELQAWRVGTVKDQLLNLMLSGAGQSQLAEILRLVQSDPYPRYRDMMLIALGVAAAAAPVGLDPWVRERLREILRVGLDDEGVSFTLELPAVVHAEAERRGMAAPALADYLSRGANQDDRWGTALRVEMARVVGRHWQGDEPGARAALVAARQFRGGYAGYATIALLMLHTRCLEIDAQDLAGEPAWGFDKDRPLLDAADDYASHVNDWEFRQERKALVGQYRDWLAAPPPDLAAVRATLETIADPDSRRVYKDLASARWAAAQPPAIEGVKGLVPMFLADSTGLDLALARLVGLRIRQHPLSDNELAQLIAVCSEHFTSGNSWERERLAALPG